MDIVALEKKYQDLYAPTCEILIEGQNILHLGVEVTDVNVDNTLDGADTFSFTVFNAFDPINRELQSFVESAFSFDAEVEIKFGYGSNTKTIMLGIITAVKIDFPSGGSPQVEVSGFDLSYRMMKENKPRSWNDKKDSEAVQNIAKEYKLTENIDNTNTQHEQIIKQEKENDFEFLNRLAERNYYEFFVFNKKLYFRKPQYRSTAIVTLEWQKSLVSFSPDFNIAERVFKIQVIGQNTDEKKNIVATAEIYNDEISKMLDRKTGGDTNGKPTTEQLLEEQVKQPLKSESHAKSLAKSILLKKHEDVLKGNGESIGIPDISPGTNIELKGLGSQFSNTYYIEQTNHSISNSGYKTTFSVKRVPNEDEIEVTVTTTPLS